MTKVINKRIGASVSLVLIVLSLILSLASCKKKYDGPDYTIYNEAGEEYSFSDFVGEPTVVNIWATWCYYCTLEMPDFEEAYKKHTDVQFIMLNATDSSYETVERASAYVKENGFTFPVYYDTLSEAQQTLGVEAYPMTYFYNAKGELVETHRGMISPEQLEEKIALIKEDK